VETLSVILLSIFTVLNALDVCETQFAITNLGARERNPFMAPILNKFGLKGMIFLKLIACGIGFILTLLPNGLIGLAIATGMMWITISWNAGFISGVIKEVKSGKPSRRALSRSGRSLPNSRSACGTL
jgi:hypothetical protein